MKNAIIALVCLCTAPSGFAAGSDMPEAAAREKARRARVVKSFDFDERRLGNFDSMPMGWRRVVEAGYPRFLEASFDESTGHQAAPSFFLPLRGGNLGASFTGREIPVDPRSAYRITAWIRAQNLVSGRAFITACYLGQNLKPMAGTMMKSEPVRHAGADGPWRQVTIDLPAGVEPARWIALSCRVEQERTAESDDRAFQPIEKHDPLGAAWFDDIRVIRLPKLSLELNDPQGVFEHGREPTIRITAEDLNGDDLSIGLDLFDADDRLIERQTIDAHRLLREPFRHQPGATGPGLYTVSLEMKAGAQQLAVLTRRFVRLSASESREGTGPCGLGLILDGSAARHPDASKRCVSLLRPDLVKLPVWRSEMDDNTVLKGEASFEAMVKSLYDAGVGLVGVFDAPPRSLASQYPRGRRSLFEVLAAEPAEWRPYLALVLTRYGLWMSYWQIGPDRAHSIDDRPLIASAVRNMAEEMRPLIGAARMVVPQSTDWAIARGPATGDVVSLVSPVGRPSSQLARQLDPPAMESGARCWATLRPLDDGRYDRWWRLADFAKGILLSRCHGAGTIFTEAPWRVRSEGGREFVEPREEMILLRTLGSELAGLKPIGRVRIAPGVESWLFADDTLQVGAVAAWTTGSSPDGMTATFDFGRAIERVTLWGHRSDCPRSYEGNSISIDGMPVILAGVDPPWVLTSSSFSLDQPSIPPAIETHERTVALNNATAGRLRGVLRISGPKGWKISPMSTLLDLEPGGTAAIPIRLRLPANQPVGEFEIVGRLKTGGAGEAETMLRAPVVVETPGLQVDVAAFRESGRIRVMQRVTNLTSGELDLRASLIATDRPRQWRTISRLGAGESAVRQFEIEAPTELSGKAVRVSVEQVGGDLRHHALVNLD